MKTNTLSITIPVPFDEALEKAQKAVIAHGFLLLHEINPQQILAQHSISVQKIRQLLFFHPDYMKQIIIHDPAAIIEAPLKIVLIETNSAAMLYYFDVKSHFEGYQLPVEMIGILKKK